MRGLNSCSIVNCSSNKYHAKGLCPRHYKVYQKYGDANYPVRRPEQHNMVGTPEYRAWAHILTRCYLKSVRNYKDYGGRGIRVCERWRNSFTAFYEDMGERPVGMTIDRINNDGNYEPSNCRWATPIVQGRNTRKSSANKSGYRGICRDGNKWQAYIYLNRRKIKIGYFSNLLEAVKARKNAELAYWS